VQTQLIQIRKEKEPNKE